MNSGGEVDPLSVMPRRYADATPEDFAAYREALAVQRQNDEAFARANDAVIVEGPWDGIAALPVAYVGIGEDGQRARLVGIAQAWRYSPFLGTYRPTAGSEELAIKRVQATGEMVVQRIQLGRPMAGMVVGRAGGQSPVQSYGVIDGKDYYFRSRGEHWSMSIGETDTHPSPDWYYEERYGAWPDAGGISAEQAYDFIAEAAEKFRSGVPTMTTRTVDRGVQSILDAIGQLTTK